MSSPPSTPTQRPASSHRRHPSSLDMSHNTASRRQSFTRRNSGYSPITPRSSHEFEHSPAHQFDGGGDGNGLGNLADELGEMYDDDDEGMEGEYGEELDEAQDENIGTAVEHDGSYGVDSAASLNGVRDSGVAMQDSSPARLSPGSAVKTKKHTRQRSLYDGSDYGDDSDLENEGISPALDARMAAIESLARRGMEENGSASDEVVKRVTQQLRDLGSQIAMENGATRLKTAHEALTTHLTHQSRTLTSIAVSFSGPFAIFPDPEDIDELLPIIQTTLELLPHPSADPLVAISHLTHSSRELIQHLSNVSDTLHMSRQTTANAARRLKVSKEQLQDWKRDNEKTQEGQEYIEHGDWDRRLKEREAKRACANVLDGFEDVCGQWRKRLCEGLGVASADVPDEDAYIRPYWHPASASTAPEPPAESEWSDCTPVKAAPKKPTQQTSTDSMFPNSSDEMH
ncbi:hypothetical protein J4E86_007422 [Alternaria arbusti]|uniref:uncharacterized protein n=1 Tax=Alternaria arbusti TaxID=232088 RepID=UPI00221E89F6|nr:uncharacterized protein J4E86_007422 [Alternaria arbusti]KAI4950914.1 hypothetical protein J4E86_007422 [Alternaria arbusti]